MAPCPTRMVLATAALGRRLFDVRHSGDEVERSLEFKYPAKLEHQVTITIRNLV